MNKTACVFLSTILFPGFVLAENYTLEINGMVCEHCANRLERELKTLEKVESVAVDLKTKQVSLETAEGHNLNEDQVRKVVMDSGFALAKFAIADAQKDRPAHP